MNQNGGNNMLLLDYLKWRNDVSFSVSDFNDVDNVILSCLAYMDFGELFSEQNRTYSIEEVFKLFCEKHSLEELKENKMFIERVPLLLEDMVLGDRFKGTKIGYYREDFEKESVKQFAAVVFILPDGRNYISFRGTDSTITGWKEDFLMSCSSDTEGAKEAVTYLNEVSNFLEGDLMIGGHSKGGNFAMYASCFCDESVKERIIKVYNNDGPGFRDEIINTDEYKKALPKICSIVPQTSMIGQLLSNEAEQIVIKSNATGIFQHDAMTWEVEKDKFVDSELDDFSKFVNSALGTWLEELDNETRESVVSTVFTMIEDTGAETFKELGASLFKNAELIIKGLVNLPKEKRDELMTALGSLVQISSKNIFDKIPKIQFSNPFSADQIGNAE
jgi:hypothetical protein